MLINTLDSRIRVPARLAKKLETFGVDAKVSLLVRPPSLAHRPLLSVPSWRATASP